MRTSALISLAGFLIMASTGTANLTAAPVKRAPITVSVPDLGCSSSLGANTFEARSWSWGAANNTSDTTGGGSGVGKAVVNELLLTRVADACSPALLEGVVVGKHFKTLTLSQYDAGGVLKATVAVEDLLITNWEIGGTSSSADVLEQVSVSFQKFTFTDAASGAKVSYGGTTQ